MTAKVRQASPEETASIFKAEGYDTQAVILEEDGETKGHCCISLTPQGCFAHDFECHAQDPHAVLKLGRAAKKLAKKRGAKKIISHVEAGGERRVLDFWLGVGFKPRAIMLEMDL